MSKCGHWLMKSEPDVFSIHDLERVGREPRSGVRNYQARNFMWKEMRVGDDVLFYHSSCEMPGIYGVAKVASAAYPDPTQFDPESEYHDPKATAENPRWWLVDVAFERAFEHPLTLDQLRANADALDGFALLSRGNRLSILPVNAAQWSTIKKLEKKS